MIEVHIFGLHLEQIHQNRPNWTNKLDPYGVVVAVCSWDEELEGVEAEHDCCEDADGRNQQFSVIVVGGHQVVVWNGPDEQSDDLENHNASVSHGVERNLS